MDEYRGAFAMLDGIIQQYSIGKYAINPNTGGSAASVNPEQAFNPGAVMGMVMAYKEAYNAYKNAAG
ncbi:MAG: hypothetical protein K6E88_04505 [Lachnospiraceae bacterium]|nr:hypothetical protein [Lachnospiraceae bacterium]